MSWCPSLPARCSPGPRKGSSQCSRKAFLLWSLSPLPCSLGHRFVKKYSWEGESVCTSPPEHEEEVIPCWGLWPQTRLGAGTDTDPRPGLNSSTQGLHSCWFSWTRIQIADKCGIKLLAFGQECPPMLLLLCSSAPSPLLGKGSGIWGRKTPGSVPVENTSFGKLELLFSPSIPWLWREGRCRPRSPPAQPCQNPVEGRKSGAGSQDKPPGSLRNYSTGIVLQVNVFN